MFIYIKAKYNHRYNFVIAGNALFWAVVVGSPTILDLLLNKGGIDPTMRSFKVESLLHIAASLGHATLIPTLIKECQIDPMLKDVTRKSALDRYIKIRLLLYVYIIGDKEQLNESVIYFYSIS